MNRLTKLLAAVASITAVTLSLPGVSQAAGVAAGEIVSNTATVNYEVNGAAQTPINSTTVDFTVDRVIDLTLVQDGTANTLVTPNTTAQVTAFILTNDSNAAQGYTFAAVDQATGTAVNAGPNDTIDVGPFTVFVDNQLAGTVGVYDPGVDTDTSVTTLDPDLSVFVFVLADIPITAVDGDVAAVQLTATSVEPGTTTQPTTSASNGEDVLDTVVVGTGTASDLDGYEVEAAALTITKSQATISDPVNAVAPFFNIPGAVVQYTVTIENTGSADAQNIVVADTIAAQLDISPSPTVSIDNDGTASTCTADVNDTDADGCGYVVNDQGTPGDTTDDTQDVTIDPTAGLTVVAGTILTVTFDVTIR